jgi:hypothetical protein
MLHAISHTSITVFRFSEVDTATLSFRVGSWHSVLRFIAQNQICKRMLWLKTFWHHCFIEQVAEIGAVVTHVTSCRILVPQDVLCTALHNYRQAERERELATDVVRVVRLLSASPKQDEMERIVASISKLKKKTKLRLVRKRTIPTERPQLAGEVSTNFSW